MHKNAKNAAIRFLKIKEYQILDATYEDFYDTDIIALSPNNTLVFAEVLHGIEEYPEEPLDDKTRERFEACAQRFLEDHSHLVDIVIRFDIISVNVLATDRAIIRHHINCFSQHDKTDLDGILDQIKQAIEKGDDESARRILDSLAS